MLVFISDLHFVDGTAGEHNPPPQAFEYFFEDLVGIAHKKGNAIKEIKIVLLGDIFDLLRTEKWFGVPEDDRPWMNKGKIEANALRILKGIINHQENQKAFDAIRTGMATLQGRCEKNSKCQLESPPRLFYIPGNHDRLCNQYSSLRAEVCASLGIPREWHKDSYPFLHSHEDPRYGVFARHGHEFDVYNYESGKSYSEQDYERVPIGDPITTELLARLPYELGLRLERKGVPASERQDIKRRFQALDEVRPLGAVVEWLLFRIQDETSDIVQEAYDEAIDSIVENFDQLEYVKIWYGIHGEPLKVDETDKIKSFLFILKNLKLSNLTTLLKYLDKAKDFFLKDDLLEAAPKEALQDPYIRYVVYGHTHEPLTRALQSVQGIGQVYLNSGTWRTRYFKATQDNSFNNWKNMTYLIFYREDERGTDFPGFETWTGTLKTV